MSVARLVALAATVACSVTACAGGSSTPDGPSAPSTTSVPGDSVTTSTSIAPPMLAQYADPAGVPFDLEIEIGRSVEGRSITVVRHGERDGARVLVVGCIHGDESAGTAIVDALRNAPLPAGVDLWLVRTVNPDGMAGSTRLNANRVDLNRNFPPTWKSLGEIGDWEYGGPAAASEPETRAMVALGSLVQPDLVLWYHQDLNRISPASGRQGDIRARYAGLTGLPLAGVSGGTYTGTANRWGKSVVPDEGASFTVELGTSLIPGQVEAHAAAVITVAREFFPR